MTPKSLIPILFIISVLNTSVCAQKVVTAERIGPFSDGLAAIMLDNKWSFIDTDGNSVLKTNHTLFIEKYGGFPLFMNGRLAVYDENVNGCGYINKQGELVIPFRYQAAYGFYDTLAVVRDGFDFYLVDTMGNYTAMIKAAFPYEGTVYKNGFAIYKKNFLFGYVDGYGNEVIPAKYSEARDFSEGLALVKFDYKWGFINRKGETIIEHKFQNEPGKFSCGRSFVQSSDGKWGFMDTTGKMIAEPKYNQVFHFTNNFAVVSMTDKNYNENFYIIDINDKVVKEFKRGAKSSENIVLQSGFSEGLAIAEKGGKKGFIDEKGNVAIDFRFRDVRPFSDGRAYAEITDTKSNKTKVCFIDKKGNIVFYVEPPQF